MNRLLRARRYVLSQAPSSAAVAEPLERRLLLTTVMLKHGELIIYGSDQADSIGIEQDRRHTGHPG